MGPGTAQVRPCVWSSAIQPSPSTPHAMEHAAMRLQGKLWHNMAQHGSPEGPALGGGAGHEAGGALRQLRLQQVGTRK